MKIKNLFLITSLCGIALLVGGCTSCPTNTHTQYHEQQYNKHHKKHKHHKSDPAVFQQTYSDSDVRAVKANMYTRSSMGGQSEMGIIKFKETDDGLKMNVDLISLRPGKVYTAQIYQCGACNDNTCCAVEAMSIDLPKLSVNNTGERLQESYIVRGLTATQLNNAKIILTRDNGYKAAWGTLNK